MPNIRCINVENYKLTEGKIYPIAGETRDFYSLLNDNNVGVRYAKRLFEVVPDDAVTRTPRTAPVPPPPPVRTERDLVQSIQIINGQVSFTDSENVVQTIEDQFNRNDSAISCGVKQISGINAQIDEIDRFFDLEEDDFLTIRKALFNKCIEHYVQRQYLTGVIFGILSTNTSGTDNRTEADEDMLSILDNIAISNTPSLVNPNTGREIKVWVLQAL